MRTTSINSIPWCACACSGVSTTSFHLLNDAGLAYTKHTGLGVLQSFLSARQQGFRDVDQHLPASLQVPGR